MPNAPGTLLIARSPSPHQQNVLLLRQFMLETWYTYTRMDPSLEHGIITWLCLWTGTGTTASLLALNAEAHCIVYYNLNVTW